MFFGLHSPFVEHCFIQELERFEGGVRSQVLLRPALTNSLGGAHGGLVATILDATMIVAARYVLSPDGLREVGTIDLSVSYIGQAKTSIACEAKPTAERKTMLFMEGLAWNESGELIARATSTIRIFPPAT